MVVFGNIRFVGDENYGVVYFMDVFEDVYNFNGGFCVEVIGRFICENDGRLVYQCFGNSDLLLLIVGEFIGFMVYLVVQFYFSEDFMGVVKMGRFGLFGVYQRQCYIF